MSAPTNPWKTVNSRIVHQSKWLTVYEDEVVKPSGQLGIYTYTQSLPFVLAVGFDGERFTMVRQYRYPLKRVMTEFPGGSIDEGELPLEAAKREFTEETGLVAQKWVQLGQIHNPNLATVFLAEELSESGHNEMAEDGIAEVVRLSWPEIDHMITAGEFTDSKTLACLMLFERHHLGDPSKREGQDE